MEKGAQQATKKGAKDRSKDVVDEILEERFQKEYEDDVANGVSPDEAARRKENKERQLENIKDENMWDKLDRAKKLWDDIKKNNKLPLPGKKADKQCQVTN